MGWADELVGAAPVEDKSGFKMGPRGLPVMEIVGTAPTSWADELSSTKPATPAPAPAAAPVTAWEKYGGEAGRQLGLTARHAITGLTGIPAVFGNALNGAINLGSAGVNAVAGTKIPMLQMPSQIIQGAESAAGLPEPKNAMERLVGDGASALTGVGGSIAAGRSLANFAAPGVSTLGKTLAAVPGNQMVAATAAGVAGGGAREAGLGPGWQLAASLAGGVAGALGAGAAGSAARWGASKTMPSLTEMVAPGSIPPPTPASAIKPAIDEILSGSVSPSKDQAAALTSRTGSLLQNAPTASPFAAARAADFKQLGIQPTLGQITRDPALFAQEQNMRGLPNVGGPLLSRFTAQNDQLASTLKNIVGTPLESYQSGNKVIGALSTIDDSMKAAVSKAYKDAAASSGAQLDVPLTGVAQDYARVLHDFGTSVPSGVRNNFEGLGLQSGMQKKLFTVDDAENLLKVINQNRDPIPGTPTNAALDQLSSSVKQAVLTADDRGGAFAVARALAKERFDLHDNVPALAAAVRGKVAPDDFMRNFIINGKTDDVSSLARLLATGNPEALSVARPVLGSALTRAGFGANGAGDGLFTPARYNDQLTAIGSAKLGSLFTPAEVDTLKQIGRVGSYINQRPGPSAVNSSNTGSALMSHASEIPWIGKYVDSAVKKSFVSRALLADLADTAPKGLLGSPTISKPAISLLDGAGAPVNR